MSGPEWMLIGAVPPITFCLGGIWGWLRQIHRVLLEIQYQMVLSEIRSNRTLLRADEALRILKDDAP